MNIIAFSDIHSSLYYLKADSSAVSDLKSADLVLISGDITNFGDAAQAEAVLDRIRKYNKNVFAVPGNCDPAGVDEYLRSDDLNLNCNCVEYGEFALVGIGGSLGCERRGRDAGKEGDIAVCLKHVAERVPEHLKMIFVSHYPPLNTNVDGVSGYNGGSESIRRFIEEYQPILSISGHIHEASGTDKIGETTLVNPGSLREGSYALIEVCQTVEKVEIIRL